MRGDRFRLVIFPESSDLDSGTDGTCTQGFSMLSQSCPSRFAKDILYALDAEALADFQTAWASRSVQTWDPFQEPASAKALLGVSERVRKCLTYPRRMIPTLQS